jgi:DNA-directed RNA polymerase specialized sigma24 family protein
MAEGATEPTPRQRQEAALRRAKEQARGGDPVAMVEALHESRALDGLASRLRRSWPGLSATDVDQVIAAAVDAVYAAVSRGRIVHDLMPWLVKVCHRLAWRTAEVVTDPHSMKVVVEDWDPAAFDRMAEGGGRAHDGAEEDAPERRRNEAIATAKRLLPQLGQENVQHVMACLIEAVEAGDPDLPHRVVAEILGLNVGTVRVLMKRGLDRLARIARAEGLVHVGFEFLKLDEPEAPSEDGA